MKTKSDEYVTTCKAYLDPQGVELDLSTCGKTINLYNTYVPEKNFYIFLCTYPIM